MQAFEVARERMETLLARDSVKENVDYGTSLKYPHINWESSVETFDEPIKSEMWVRAVCSATYIDSQGYEQKVELAHWLTNISKRQMLDIIKQLDEREKILKNQLIPTISKAAAYADVPTETIRFWIDNGMPTASNGAFIKDALDLYKDSQGYPSPENIAKVDKMYRFISQSITKEVTTSPTGSESTSQQPGTGEGPSQGSQGQPSQQDRTGRAQQPSPPNSGEKLYFGLYTDQQLREMSVAEIWKLLREYYGF
jgi:hypothetical protein